MAPVGGEIISQEEAAWAVQFFGTKVFSEKVTVCAGGLDVPSAAVNESGAGVGIGEGGTNVPIRIAPRSATATC